MAKRPRSPEQKETQDAKRRREGLARRDFVKLVGSAVVAVSAGVLSGAALAEAQAQSAAAPKLVGPGPVKIVLRVNGALKTVSVEPRVTLLDALRDHLDYTGAKKVCDRGTCGACTVILNGKAVYSCSVLALDVSQAVAGPAADIRTIEGLAPEGQLHPLSAAFVDNDAQQCGFCTPGFVMACKAYLDSHPHPNYEEVKHALGGNLCRCGTYMGVRHAVVDAALRLKGGRA